MKKLRAMVLSLMVGATVFLGMGNWAIAAESGYAFARPDVRASFTTEPCKDPDILARIREDYRPKFRAGLIALATGERVEVCWITYDGAIHFIAADGAPGAIPFNTPGLEKSREF